MNNPCASIVEHFDNLSDPRVDRTKLHKLGDIVTIAICSVPCMGDSYDDMEDFGKARQEWRATFLELPAGFLPTTPLIEYFGRLIQKSLKNVLSVG